MIRSLSVPVFVTDMLVGSVGNFSVSLSPFASNRSTTALLHGRTLKSDIIRFTFVPSSSDSEAGMQSATISINASSLVAAGKTLKWYKFNEVLSVWDLRGGDYNKTTGLLEYTTTSFSDWSVQESTDGTSDDDSWRTPPVVFMVFGMIGCLAILVGVSVLIFMGVRCCCERHSAYAQV